MKDLSREFLEEAWAAAKKKLPGWAYAALLTESRARAGGKARGAISRARQAQLLRQSMNVVKTGSDGVCLVFKVPKEIAERIAQQGGEAVEDLHLTLMYFGQRSSWSEDELRILVRTVAEQARGNKPVLAKISGTGRFTESGATYASVDAPGLSAFRERLVRALDAAAIDPDEFHGFDPHVTLFYGDEAKNIELPLLEFALSDLCIYAGDEAYEMSLDGQLHVVDIPPRPEDQEATDKSRKAIDKPLEEGGDQATISRNIERLIGEGYSKDQAAAIAYRTAGKEKKIKAEVPAVGAEGSVLFVGGSPLAIDRIRGEAFSGPVGETINENYLKPLGLTRADAAFVHAVPYVCKAEDERAAMMESREWLLTQIERLKPRAVIALGRVAKQALGDRADFRLPHPALVRLGKDPGVDAEMSRKLTSIRKKLDSHKGPDNIGRILFPAPSGAQDSAARNSAQADPKAIRIFKADDVYKHVYGVVLDPYVIDAHDDWIPPREIYETATRYMTDYRMVSAHHMKLTDARVCASFVEEYPPGEQARAYAGEEHRVYRREFGGDWVHSGSWVMGVALTDDLWERYKKGEFQAFSIEGFATKTRISPAAMPKFSVVDLVPSNNL